MIMLVYDTVLPDIVSVRGVSERAGAGRAGRGGEVRGMTRGNKIRVRPTEKFVSDLEETPQHSVCRHSAVAKFEAAIRNDGEDGFCGRFFDKRSQ
jgi:hypothetical protein